MPGRTLPNIGLTGFWPLGEDGWKDSNDLNLLKLSVLVQAGAINMVSAEPGAPVDGDVYILDQTHATHPNAVAIQDNGAWVYISPVEGWLIYNRTANYFLLFDGGLWAEYAPSGVFVIATVAEAWTGTNDAKGLTPKRLFDMAETQVITDAASLAIDGNAGVNFKVTLGGNRTLENPTNMKTGQSGIIIITQDATGTRTLAYGTNWKFPGGAAVGGVLSTAAGAVDIISYFVRSDGTIIANLAKDFK